jgi:hypothetical protein
MQIAICEEQGTHPGSKALIMSGNERWEASMGLRDSAYLWIFGLPLPILLLLVLWMHP